MKDDHERTYAMAYARVSTSKQAVEGDSLELQADLLARHASVKEWHLFPDEGVFKEPFTGTVHDRPEYQRAIRLIKANPGKVRYFLVKSIDRFSRAGALEYRQMKAELSSLGVELRDIGGVIQPKVNSLEHLGFAYSWSERSPSDISEVVLAEAADQERSRMLARLVESQVKLTQSGYHLGPANDGYVAKRIVVDGKRRFAQFPDPDRAHFFTTLFAMRAEGLHSDPEIVRHLNNMGFRTKPMNRWDKTRTRLIGTKPGRALTVQHLQTLVQHPAYCGVVVRHWTHGKPIRASGGEALVSIATFNAANRGKVFIEERPDGSLGILYDYHPARVARKRVKYSRRWPFKNVVACSRCGQPLFASSSRGKSGQHFGAYHCSRGHARYSVNQKALDTAFSAFLSRLVFDSRHLEAFSLVLRATFEEARHEWQVKTSTMAEKISDLEERRNRLALAFADATLPTIRRILEKQVAALEDSAAQLVQSNNAFDGSEDDLESFLEYANKVLEHPASILENAGDFREQVAIFGLFFDGWPTYEEIAFGTPKMRPTLAVMDEISKANSESVHRRRFDWNTLRQEIERWMDAKWAIDSIRDRLPHRRHRAA